MSLPAAAQTPERVTLTVLGTTDVHGNILPFDYLGNRAAERGLAKIATLVKQARAENPRTLLLDCGDTIQGTSLAYYYARKNSSGPNPTIAAMNAMRYDAMAVGNHEFNFGLDIFWRAKREAQFPFLAANVRQSYKKGTDGHIPPYVIKTIGGVRVGIVAFITPGVPTWELPAHYRGYKFESIVAAARRVIPQVRKQADVVIVLSHSGLDRDAATGRAYPQELSGENATWQLAEQVPGIDVIFFGHTHGEVPEKVVNGVLLVQPRNWAQSLARADIALERSSAGKWTVTAKRSRTIPVTPAVPPDAEIVALAQPIHDAAQRYLDTPLATLAKPLEGRTGRVEDSALVDLIHRVQMEYGKADVSMATIFIPSLRYEPGPITVRYLDALYPYENTLYVVELTGAQFKEALEHAASFYPAWPPREGERFAPPPYQADVAEGVTYTLDLTRPVGDRIRNLQFRGQPLAPKQKLRVATHNYRYTGGGGYRMYKKGRLVYRSEKEIRELLIEYVTREKQIPVTPTSNWSIVPAEARAALVEATGRRAPTPPASAAGGPAQSRIPALRAQVPASLWKMFSRMGQRR